MRIAEIIGSVTLARGHPLLAGSRYIIGVPCSLSALRTGRGDGEDLVMVDEFGSGLGSLVTFSEGAEAAAPYHPKKVPVDAYVAALLDAIDLPERGGDS